MKSVVIIAKFVTLQSFAYLLSLSSIQMREFSFLEGLKLALQNSDDFHYILVPETSSHKDLWLDIGSRLLVVDHTDLFTTLCISTYANG